MDVVTDEVHIKEVINEARLGKTVTMIGLGNSMRPLLEDRRDYIELRFISEEEEIKKYDIVFYRSYTGAYVLHRIYMVTKDGYRMNGDGNILVEPVVSRKDVYLKAVAIWRNGRYIRLDHILYRLYSVLWGRLLPVRSHLLRIYGVIRKSRRGGVRE